MAFIHDNRDVFSLPGEPPGGTNWVQHELMLKEVPIKQSVHRPPIHLRDAAHKEVQKMLWKA